MTKLVKQLDTQLKIIGFEEGYLGSHYCQKGVATIVDAGCTMTPPIVALFIQTGWFLGGVKEKYLFRDKASDQYVRHCTSLLDQLQK